MPIIPRRAPRPTSTTTRSTSTCPAIVSADDGTLDLLALTIATGVLGELRRAARA